MTLETLVVDGGEFLGHQVFKLPAAVGAQENHNCRG